MLRRTRNIRGKLSDSLPKSSKVIGWFGNRYLTCKKWGCLTSLDGPHLYKK